MFHPRLDKEIDTVGLGLGCPRCPRIPQSPVSSRKLPHQAELGESFPQPWLRTVAVNEDLAKNMDNE